MIYLILKCYGDDGSDINGCMLAISAEGFKAIQKHAIIADTVSKAHSSFNALSFTITFSDDLDGVEVFWLGSESEWEDKFDVEPQTSHAFISEADFEQLKEAEEPDWRICYDRITFNKSGDCFIEGSYDNAHGYEESEMLPIAEIANQLFQQGREQQQGSYANV